MTVNVRPHKRGHLVDVRVTFPDGTFQRDRKILRSVTRAMAREWGIDRERALLKNRGKVQAPRFDVFASEWLKTYPTSAGNSHTTISNKTQHVNVHLVPFFGTTTLDRIDAKRIEQFIGEMRGKEVGDHLLSPRTVAHVLSTLRKMLNTAIAWGVLDKMPTLPKIKQGEVSYAWYDADEARRLIDGAATALDRTILIVAIQTGMRAGEMLALRVGDLDLKRKLVTLSRSSTAGVERASTKSGKVRTVPLSDLCAAAIKAHLAQRTVQSLDGDDLVFATSDGSPLVIRALHTALGRAQKKAGLRRVRFHDLRHSYGSILVAAGTPIRQVQAWMGHATIAMTMRYSHLAPFGGREHLAAFDGEPMSAPVAEYK